MTTAPSCTEGSGGEEVAGEVEEDRRGEAERVDAVEDTPVPGDEGAEVLDAAVALDRRHGEPSRKAHQRNHQRHQRRLPGREGRRPPEGGPHDGRRRDAAEEALPRLIRADRRGDAMAPEQLPPDVLEDIAALYHDDQEEEEFGVLVLVTGDVER